MKFSGQHLILPWNKWDGILISPDEIIISESRKIEVDKLSLIWWKAGVYDRFNDDRTPPF